jgi:hypothetical protein
MNAVLKPTMTTRDLPPAGADDPPPVPPEAPAPEECCNSGCIPCVYDTYNEAMDEYRDALKAWRARHGQAG